MKPSIELCDQGESARLDAFLVERIYEFNARATGYVDGRLIAGRIVDDAGDVVAGFSGHTWGGCCVLTNVWVHESLRGRGYGRALLLAAEAEAVRRRCEQVVLATHDFQAPGFYAKLGYEAYGRVEGTPRGSGQTWFKKSLA